MTGNGIESDFVLPDSLFISDYSTLPSFYPHFGANCRFFCTISMSPDSSTPFASRTRGAASGLRQRVFDPLDSRSRDSVERIFTLCPRADWGNPRGAAPGPRQRVFDPLDSRSRNCVGDALMLCPRADPVSKRAAPACRDSPSDSPYSVFTPAGTSAAISAVRQSPDPSPAPAHPPYTHSSGRQWAIPPASPA